jgi:hypothetical protein
MAAHVSMEAFDGGARMTTESVFVDVAQMEKMLAMGMAEGMTQAVDQIERLLS